MSIFGGNPYLPLNTIRPKFNWTPIVTIGSGIGTVGAINKGKYTLIGPKLVVITAFVSFTFTSAGGSVDISLPFKVSNESASSGMIVGYDPSLTLKMVYCTLLSGQKSMTPNFADGTGFNAAGSYQLDLGGFYYIL